MIPNSRRTFVFLGGLALFALLIIFGADTLLKRVPASQSVPPPSSPETEPAPDSAPGVEENSAPFSIERGAEDRRPLIYGSGGFQPTALTIQETDDLGCVITVINRSSTLLGIGVDPHNPAGDPGANYGEIGPGERAIIDTRYNVPNGVRLHNHLNPEHGFAVTYGPGCQ